MEGLCVSGIHNFDSFLDDVHDDDGLKAIQSVGVLGHWRVILPSLHQAMRRFASRTSCVS